MQTLNLNLQPILKKNQYEVMAFIRKNEKPLANSTNGWVFEGQVDSTPIKIYSKIDRKTWGSIYTLLVGNETKQYKTAMGLIKSLRKI